MTTYGSRKDEFMETNYNGHKHSYDMTGWFFLRNDINCFMSYVRRVERSRACDLRILHANRRDIINPLRAEFFRGNINLYLHFVSFLHIDTTQVIEILPQIRQEPTYSA